MAAVPVPVPAGRFFKQGKTSREIASTNACCTAVDRIVSSHQSTHGSEDPTRWYHMHIAHGHVQLLLSLDSHTTDGNRRHGFVYIQRSIQGGNAHEGVDCRQRNNNPCPRTRVEGSRGFCHTVWADGQTKPHARNRHPKPKTQTPNYTKFPSRV